MTARRENLDQWLDLHVFELANVEMPAEVPFGPAQEEIAGRLHHPAAMHDPLAVVGMQAFAGIGFEDRRAGLLDLQKQGIVARRPSAARCRKRCRRCRLRPP